MAELHHIQVTCQYCGAVVSCESKFLDRDTLSLKVAPCKCQQERIAELEAIIGRLERLDLEP